MELNDQTSPDEIERYVHELLERLTSRPEAEAAKGNWKASMLADMELRQHWEIESIQTSLILLAEFLGEGGWAAFERRLEEFVDLSCWLDRLDELADEVGDPPWLHETVTPTGLMVMYGLATVVKMLLELIESVGYSPAPAMQLSQGYIRPGVSLNKTGGGFIGQFHTPLPADAD